MQTMTLHFRPKKETKGTVVFEEVQADGSPSFNPSIPTVYIQKHAMPDGKVPRVLRMTVEPGE